MLHVRKLMKKSLKNICKLIKINKKFLSYIISLETFVIEGFGTSHSQFTF